MDIGMYQGAAALNAYTQWQNNISHNLANSHTAGFKQHAFAIKQQPMGLIPTSNNSPFARSMWGSSPEAEHQLSFNDGALQKTGKLTDLALQGDGFFEVQTPEGGTIYTRNGEFHINNENTLVNKDGYNVLSAGGAAITVDPSLGDMMVNGSGEVYQGEAQIGQIAVSAIDDPKALAPTSGGFVLNGEAEVAPAEAGTFSVVQGYTEGSNISSMREMIHMIQASRAYENNTKVIGTYDTRYSQAIQQLGTT